MKTWKGRIWALFKSQKTVISLKSDRVMCYIFPILIVIVAGYIGCISFLGGRRLIIDGGLMVNYTFGIAFLFPAFNALGKKSI